MPGGRAMRKKWIENGRKIYSLSVRHDGTGCVLDAQANLLFMPFLD
jgi:hypothetical protein